MANERDPTIRLRASNDTDAAFRAAQENLRNLASSAAVVQGPLGSVAGRINAVGAALTRMNPLMIAGATAFSSLIAFQVQAVESASEFEKQMFRIEEQLKLTGNAAGFTSQQLFILSEQIDATTLASSKGVRDAISALLQFNVHSRENFEGLLRIAQDMSAVFGGDIITNTRKLGRALEDPKNGLETLRRIVPAFTNEFRDLVSAMYESGNAAKGAGLIMDELTKKFSGQGQAEGKGLAGHVDELNRQWELLKRNFAASGVYDIAITKLSQMLELLNNGADEALVNQEKYKTLSAEIVFLQNLPETNRRRQSGAINAERQARIFAIKEQLAGMRAVVEEQQREESAVAKTAETKEKLSQKEKAFISALDTQLSLYIADEHELDDIYTEREKLLKKLKPLYDDLYAKSLPPLQALEEAYSRDAVNAAQYLALKEADVEESTKVQLQILTKFYQDRSKLESDYDKTSKLINRLTIELADEEDKVKASYAKRIQEVNAALDALAKSEIGKHQALTNILIALEKKRSEDLAKLRLDRELQFTNDIAGVFGAAADYYDDLTRRTTNNINTEYAKRAQIVRDSVQAGLETEASGNEKLKALDAARQAQLDSTAKKTFEREKKLRRVQIIASTAAAAIGAAADTQAPVYVRVGAALSMAALGASQLAQLNTTNFEGGGGSIGSIGAGGGASVQTALVQPAPVRSHITIVGNSRTTFSFDQLVELANGLNELSGQFDIQIIDPKSQNAQNIINSGQVIV